VSDQSQAPGARLSEIEQLRDQHRRSAAALDFGADSPHVLTGEHAERARFEARLHRTFAEELDRLLKAASARLSAPPAERLVVALQAARQFLDPEIARGPSIYGWQNTVDMVDEELRASVPAQEEKPR